jgi:urea transporter
VINSKTDTSSSLLESENNESVTIFNGNQDQSSKKIWSLFEENILNGDKNISNIDNLKNKNLTITYRSFLGSMSDIDNIYRRDDFLKNLKWLKFILILIDSIFRGISQVMFANNPLSGLIITISLFIGNWELTIYALIGTTTSTLTAHVLDFNYNSIRSGLYGYNGCLTGMGIAYFTFSKRFEIIPFVIIMTIFSTIFYDGICKIFAHRLGIPAFTFSFQISTWIMLLSALKYQYIFINGNILKPTLLTTVINKPQPSNTSFFDYPIEDDFVGFFASIGQVFFIENPYSGLIILIGLALCSRILAFFALFGAITGQLTAAYLLNVSPKAIRAGLWGYNSVLTCQALGGMFFILSGYKIWLLIFYGSISTIFVQGAVTSFLSIVGMPCLTFPFTFICWIFCLISPSKNIIRVELTDCTIPEDHISRYRLLKFIKNQFKYINLLDVTKIEKELVPILMCTYAYRNDLKTMKILFKKINPMNLIDFNDRTPLHISASEGHFDISKWIIKKFKLNLNSMDKFGSNPLFDGFINGNFDTVNYLYLNGGRFPSSKIKELAFYLNSFIYENNIEGIKYLIQLGFNPNESDYDGRYSLHLAVNTNNFNIVRYLIEQTSISFHIKDHFNQTPYDYAVKSNQLDIQNYLLDKMTNKNIEIIVTTNSIEQTNKEEKIYSMNLEDNLLVYLLSINNIDKLSNFVNEHPNKMIFDCIDYDKRCLAHLAAIKGKYEIIEYLFQHYSQSYFDKIINQQDRWDLSSLDYAIIYQHNHIINYIKEHLSHNRIQSETNSENNNKIVHHLNKWKKIYLFLKLSASGNAQRIESLFNRGYFIHEELYADYDGRTPMHLAVAYSHMNVIQLLIHFGYKGINNKDRWGYSSLDIAQQMKYNNIIHQLKQFSH